jgi:glycosyltransferase involved in cell wall biosynthesis
VTASADSNDVVFLGGFRHPPNVDAVLWFYAEVWPRISSHRPMSRFVIAGSHPPPEILALQSERVVVTGRIDDLRPAFERARAFVAPLRYGAGVKGKIYTAMSFGTPVVTTSVGAEGIGLRAGEDALVADSPEDLAAAVIKVFADQDLERGLREAGPRFVAANATVEAGCRAMAEAIKLRPAAIGKTPA